MIAFLLFLLSPVIGIIERPVPPWAWLDTGRIVERCERPGVLPVDRAGPKVRVR